MAKDEVNIKVSADVAEAIRMWRAMEQGPEAMANAIEATGRRGKAAASGLETEWGKVVGTWTSITAGINAAKAALDALIQSQKAYDVLVKGNTVPIDTLQRAMMNQTGYSNQQGLAASKRILQIGVDRAATPQTVFETATQLASSGFAPDIATGGGLDEILKLSNSINAAGKNVNVAEIAGAVINFIQATGMPATAGSISKLGPQIHGLFQQTDLKAEHLASFAPKASNIAGMTGMKEDQLAFLSQFLERTNIDKAGTAMQAAFVGLATAGKNNSKVDALKSLGLTPQDVDFVGEDAFEVQRRMVRGFESVPRDVGNIAAATIFGAEGLLARDAIFTREQMAITQQRLAMISSGAHYQRAYQMTEGGYEAKERSSQSEDAIDFVDPSYIDPDLVKKELRRQGRKQGRSALGLHLGEMQFDFYDTSVPYMDTEAALRATLGPSASENDVQYYLNKGRSTLPADVPQFKVQVEIKDEYGFGRVTESPVERLNQAQ